MPSVIATKAVGDPVPSTSSSQLKALPGVIQNRDLLRYMQFNYPLSRGVPCDVSDATERSTEKVPSINLYLVVLSACETALSGLGQDGTEISGISSYLFHQGAKSVMASLWSVNDASTSQLMQQFYTNLSKITDQAPITKATALRQAQLSLLKSQPSDPANAQQTVVQPINPDQETRKDNVGVSHPFYWTPFILIGNSL